MITWFADKDKRNRPSDQGFTLIELLVVIVILAILSAVVVFAIRGAGDKGEAAANEIDVRTLRTAEEAFCAKFGRYGTEAELVQERFLSEESEYNDIALRSGGPCGQAGGPDSGFDIATSPTAIVNVAASQDQWPTADSASPGYRTSEWAYPLNANVYDPLIIIASNYALQPGLAVSWDAIPTGTLRQNFTSPNQPTTKPLPPGAPTYTNAPDRPYNTTTWRFNLRQGVRFHDGSEMDADDVIWTWRDRQALNGIGQATNSSLTTVTNTLGFTKNGSPCANPPACTQGTLAPDAFDSVEKVDQFTVDFTPKTENLRLPEQIAHPKGAIVPVGKHFDGRTGGLIAAPHNGNGGVGTPLDPPATSPSVPVGTGPFKYKSYAPAAGGTGSASVEVWEGYWGTRPQVKEMNFTFMVQSTARTTALLSGQYDMAIDLEPLDVDTVNAAGNHVVTASYGQNLLIYVNKVVKYGPGDNPKYDLATDPAVRRAVSLAIDRDEFVNTIYEGNAAPGRWMAPPNILGASQSDVPALAFDPALARTVLDNAGWTCGGGAAGAGTACGAGEFRVKQGSGTFAGRTLALRLIGNDISLSQAGYDLLTARIEAVGIDVTANRLTVAQRNTEYQGARFDLGLELPNQNDANPAFLPTLRFACTRSGTFRFAPVDGVNGIGPSVDGASAAPAAPNTDGRYPFGVTPCNTGAPNTTPAVLGPFDTTHVPGADLATTQAAAQAAAAQQMKILVGQNDTNVVIPIVGQFRIYGLRSNVNLGDPHPSQTSQRWVSLTKTE